VPTLEGLAILRDFAAIASGETATPEALAGLLVSGDTHVARTLILEQYIGGRPVDELLDRFVGPAMVEVGVQWAEGRVDVYQEHVATLRVVAILHDLLGVLPVAPEDAPLAIGGAPDGDPYFLPTAMAELALIDMAWRTINMGPNTPAASLLEAINHHAPRLVWLSITSHQLQPTFFEDYPRMFAAAQERGVRVMIGGQGVTDEIQDRLVASAFGTRLAHLKAFARTVEA
jgi:methanogenic corrinoid protein MtbC1